MTTTTTRPAPAPPGPRIDPRIKERRIAVARDRGRRRLRVLLGAVGTTVAVIGADLALHSSFLSVSTIRVDGAVHERPADVVRVASGARHHPLFDLDTAAVASRVEALPWVRSVRVQRHWPSTIVVEITERAPVAQVGRPGRWATVDATGRILSVDPTPDPALVTVGPAAGPGAPGTQVPAAVDPALAVAAALPRSLGGVRTVSVSAGGQVELALEGGAVVELGPPSDLGAKMEALVTVLAQVDMRGVRSIDLRVPGQPALTRA